MWVYAGIWLLGVRSMRRSEIDNFVSPQGRMAVWRSAALSSGAMPAMMEEDTKGREVRLMSCELCLSAEDNEGLEHPRTSRDLGLCCQKVHELEGKMLIGF